VAARRLCRPKIRSCRDLPVRLRGWRGDGWLAGSFKIVCLLMRRLFSLAVLIVHGDGEKDAELLCSGMRTRCCAGAPAGYGTTPPTLGLAVSAVLAVVRSFTAIAEWAADADQGTQDAPGVTGVAPCESTSRWTLQHLDADALDEAADAWAQQRTAPPAGARRVITVDGETLRGPGCQVSLPQRTHGTACSSPREPARSSQSW
jgi:hypothetical protein